MLTRSGVISGAGVLRYSALRQAIAAWMAEQADTRVFFGGSELAQSGSGGVDGADAAGRTFIMSEAVTSIRQDGLIRQIKARLTTSSGNPNNTFQIKVFRPSGTDYKFVAESAMLSVATGGVYADVTIDLATPLPCQPGDRLGVWIKGLAGNACLVASNLAGSCSYVAGNQSGDIAAASLTVSGSRRLCLSGYGTPPFLIGSGDSIMEGHNSADPWHSFYHAGPAGNPAAELLNQMRALVSTLDYQNYAKGSQTWAFVASVIADIVAQQPRAIIVQCGVNDISGGRTWADVEADLNTIAAALNGQTLFINEILPWSAATDVQAATVRTFNANYATWCAANGAVLVPAHDLLGQIRPSTGELDNMLTAYNYDNVHLTVPAGVDALAAIMTRELDAYSWA